MTADNTLALFRAHGGVMRSRDILAHGVHQATLARLRDEGRVTVLVRGVYRLAGLPPLAQPDLVALSRKVPQAVVCLISALAYHSLTDEVPHMVDCALPRGARHPHLRYPPLRVFTFERSAFDAGIEVQTIDGTPVRVYCPEKTLVDCFKFRNKLGLDVALDALRRYRAKHGLRADALMRYARVCRVQNIMRPYLEATR